jgi:hypothetical protein
MCPHAVTCLHADCWFSELALSSGEGTAYPFGAPMFTSGFSGVRVTRSLVLCVCFVDRYLSFFLQAEHIHGHL